MAAETASAPENTPPPIDISAPAGTDTRIAGRIERIYAQLPGLSRVTVTVQEGVVRLAGQTTKPGDADQAAQIASRVSGVVAVRNEIERDVSVGEGLDSVNQLTRRVTTLLNMLPLIGVALAVGTVIAFIGYAIAWPGGLWRRIAPNTFLAGLVRSAIRFAFVIGGAVVALDMIGASALLGAVLGSAGVIGLALGFAMRDTVENYVASIMLSLRQPFRANDHVLIDDMEGRVIRLTSRATVLMTLDGNHLRIPNSTVFKAVILNYTSNPQRRFQFDLGIDADDDANAGRQLGRATLAALPYVLDDPAPEARVVDVGDSNIVLRFLGWIDQREADWHKARSRAIAAVKKALEDGGFALPEPIYRLRFDQRTVPLPFENMDPRDGDAEAPASAPPPVRDSTRASSNIAADDAAHDVAPSNEIAEMVNQERSGSKAGDLLDDRRPAE